MEPPPKPSASQLFQVYLRLRPPPSPLIQLTQQSLYPLLPAPERYLTVEPPSQDVQHGMPTHITIHPPSYSRKRAVEKFAFTKVFEEEASQLDIFKGTCITSLVAGALGDGRDGLLATLGVTGSGKSHTILGSRSQRGLTQLSLDLLYRSLSPHILHPSSHPSLVSSISAADASEAQILPASSFLDDTYGDPSQSRNASRAPTPMLVGRESTLPTAYTPTSGPKNQWSILGLGTGLIPRGKDRASIRPVAPIASTNVEEKAYPRELPSQLPFWHPQRITRSNAKWRFGVSQESSTTPSVPRRNLPQRPSCLPQFPDISDLSVGADPHAEYAIVVSMYEVYNDRIFDLLTHSRNLKDLRRRALLFKSTEASPDRKVVAGLRKIVCGTYEEALMVLETGLMERRVAGTGSNSVSSRSHGFFCVEVKRRPQGGMANAWSGAQLTIVDLAGSERARNAKTAGATLAEAGKINESLMYLGQCLQLQSDCHDASKPPIVPFRQCKLTELLFSNSFATPHHSSAHHAHHHRNPQKGIMIVTADPFGDFNATSQILRYSALAREVTVPRIPSVTSTIFSGTTAVAKSQMTSGRTSPNGPSTEELEFAHVEITRLGEEVEILGVKLAEEEGRRKEAEENWQRAEERAEEIESRVREECWEEMEMRMEEERRRWKSAWGKEADHNDEHLDRKIEILSRGIEIHQDSPDDQITDLEAENDALRLKIDNLERQFQTRSPSRLSKSRKDTDVLSPRDENQMTATLTPTTSPQNYKGNNMPSLRNDNEIVPNFKGITLQDSYAMLRKTPSKGVFTPGKKMRKLTTRKWDLADEDELEGYY